MIAKLLSVLFGAALLTATASAEFSLTVHGETEADLLAPSENWRWGGQVLVPVYTTDAAVLLATFNPVLDILGYEEVRAPAEARTFDRALTLTLSVDVSNGISFTLTDNNQGNKTLSHFKGDLGQSFVPGADIIIRAYAQGDIGQMEASYLRVDGIRYGPRILSDASVTSDPGNIWLARGLVAPFTLQVSFNSQLNQPIDGTAEEVYRSLEIIQVAVPEASGSLMALFGGAGILMIRRRK
jgi:hypothetical protein